MATIDYHSLEHAMGGLFAAFGAARDADGKKIDITVSEDQLRRAAKGALLMLASDVLGEHENLTFEKAA